VLILCFSFEALLIADTPPPPHNPPPPPHPPTTPPPPPHTPPPLGTLRVFETSMDLSLPAPPFSAQWFLFPAPPALPSTLPVNVKRASRSFFSRASIPPRAHLSWVPPFSHPRSVPRPPRSDNTHIAPASHLPFPSETLMDSDARFPPCLMDSFMSSELSPPRFLDPPGFRIFSEASFGYALPDSPFLVGIWGFEPQLHRVDSLTLQGCLGW